MKIYSIVFAVSFLFLPKLERYFNEGSGVDPVVCHGLEVKIRGSMSENIEVLEFIAREGERADKGDVSPVNQGPTGDESDSNTVELKVGSKGLSKDHGTCASKFLDAIGIKKTVSTLNNNIVLDLISLEEERAETCEDLPVNQSPTADKRDSVTIEVGVESEGLNKDVSACVSKFLDAIGVKKTVSALNSIKLLELTAREEERVKKGVDSPVNQSPMVDITVKVEVESNGLDEDDSTCANNFLDLIGVKKTVSALNNIKVLELTAREEVRAKKGVDSPVNQSPMVDKSDSITVEVEVESNGLGEDDSSCANNFLDLIGVKKTVSAFSNIKVPGFISREKERESSEAEENVPSDEPLKKDEQLTGVAHEFHGNLDDGDSEFEELWEVTEDEDNGVDSATQIAVFGAQMAGSEGGDDPCFIMELVRLVLLVYMFILFTLLSSLIVRVFYMFL